MDDHGKIMKFIGGLQWGGGARRPPRRVPT